MHYIVTANTCDLIGGTITGATVIYDGDRYALQATGVVLADKNVPCSQELQVVWHV